MVYKIRFFIFCICIFSLCILGLSFKGDVETNLLKTLLPKSVHNYSDVVDIANKTSSSIKVIFEADEKEELDEVYEKFQNEIDTNYFKLNKNDVSRLIDLYLLEPTNFLSQNTKKLLKEKQYDKVYINAMRELYSPAGVQITEFANDPYLLLDDFILSSKSANVLTDSLNGKLYKVLALQIKNNEALSPKLSNKKISELVKIQKELSSKNTKIYLSGTPIHSYYTSSKAVFDINIICILSIFMIAFLTYFYFKNLKFLIPVALSISFGMLLGYIATRLWFDSFQIITMVFSTTLIGIGIDYSYHYFFAVNKGKEFIKRLSFSFLTTIVPFALLYMTQIDLLKQVSIYTVFGLFGIYITVLFLYPCFNLRQADKTFVPKREIYKWTALFISILCFIGLFRIHFNDSLEALYSPSKQLKHAEHLYGQISGEKNLKTQIIIAESDNIISKEEEIAKKLNDKNINYISLSKFLPSPNIQKENHVLVKELYKNNLYKYSEILSSAQINTLKNKTFKPVIFKAEDFAYLDGFILNKNKSIIIAYSDKALDIAGAGISIINFKNDVEHYMKQYRNILLGLFPFVFMLLAILLNFIYGYKGAAKVLLPSLSGSITGLLIVALIYGELNLFSVITAFLILGFTIDYSIFRNNAEDKTESAICVSCVTTSFSFLMLSFCGFKLLSSMGVVLFFGIITSYIVGYFIFNKDGKEESWFQVKEKFAGNKRLFISWFLYKIFGKGILYLIAFLVSLCTFLFAPKVRKYSKKYLLAIQKETNISPNLFNQFKHIYSYASSLVDKMLVYSGKYGASNIVFDSLEDKDTLYSDIKKGKGICFLFNHIGNIEVMQSILAKEENLNLKINVIASNLQSKTFKRFLETIKVDLPVNIIPVESIGFETGISLKEKLDNGEILMIAGDRLAEDNETKVIKESIFSKRILLPKGAFILAKLMNVPTYFISVVKTKEKYKIFVEKQIAADEKILAQNYARFMEKMIEISPLQFFHFYDFFKCS